MVMTIIGLNETATDEFVVTDANGAVVTGLVDGNFTRELYDPNGNDVSATVIPVITELGGGSYRVTFTPNVVGNWLLVIFHATYFPGGKAENYLCQIGGSLDSSEIANAVLDADINQHIIGSSVGEFIVRLSNRPIGGGNVTYNMTGLSNEDKQFLIENIKKMLIDLRNSLTINTELQEINTSLKTLKSFSVSNNILDEIYYDKNAEHLEHHNLYNKIEKQINKITANINIIKNDVETAIKILIKNAPDDIIDKVISDE